MNDEYAPIDLTQFDEEYASAPVEDKSEPPDGRYQAIVEKVELTRSKEKGDPMLKWQLRILHPTQIGRMLFRNNMIVTPDNIKWLKNDLAICGLMLEKLSDLPNHLERLLDVQLEITKKTKGEFSNVYFSRRIEIGNQTNSAPPDDDDLDDLRF